MMLGLELRKEFKGRRLKGTAIELTNKNKTGATQVPASDFLKITYPAADVLKTIEAVGPNQGRRKWKSAGGYPTLTQGGLSVLEVAVPWIELTKV
jgi:hypothetical protein